MYLYPLIPVLLVACIEMLRRLSRQMKAVALSDAPIWAAALAAVILILSVALVTRIVLIAPRGKRREAFAGRPVTMMLAIVTAIAATGALLTAAGSVLAAVMTMLGFTLLFALGLCAYVVGAVISLHRSYREANVEEKRQVAWPLWGTIIALGVRICVTLFGLLISVAYKPLGWTFDTVMITAQVFEIFSRGLYILIPISFAIAILKYRLMNIDIIIRKTVVYAILSTIILVLYLGLVGGIGALLVEVTGIRNQTFVIASTLFVAMIFVPLRNKLQTLTDRNLFRQRYDFAATLEAISASSRIATDATTLLATSAEQLQQTVQNRAIVVFLERQREFVATAKVGVSDTLLGRLSVPESFGGLLDRPFDPRRRGLDPETASTLQRIGTVLVVPLGGLGFIAAAARLDTRELDVEDIDFLSKAAETLASAVDRIRMQAEGADFAQARSIQQALLPHDLPSIPGLDISGRWQPARTMGGDYYDVIRLAEDEVAICIGDVAGKGMPAALLMSGLQAAVRASASSSPRDLCERVRRVVVSSLSGGRFVTFFYATVNTTEMKVRWCNAGHNPPLLAHADGSLDHLESGGPAFSRLLKTSYEENERTLVPGDRLVLFTDGVTEARGADGEMLGDERLEKAVIAERHSSAATLQHAIVEAAETFSKADLEDDLTVVVVAVGG
jgi:MFS family permease